MLPPDKTMPGKMVPAVTEPTVNVVKEIEEVAMTALHLIAPVIVVDVTV